MARPRMRHILLVTTAVLFTAGAACSESSDTSELVDPPDGTRWVGVDRVAFAVPEEWPTDIGHGCPGRSEPGVTFSGEHNVLYDCSAPPDDYVVPDLFNVDFLGSDETFDETVDVDGIEIGFREECDDDTCVLRFEIDDDDIAGVIRLTGADAAETARTIFDSAVRLPDGLVGVPMAGDAVDPDDAADVMEDAGLVADHSELGVSARGEVRSASWSDPAPGTIVEVGSEVSLLSDHP